MYTSNSDSPINNGILKDGSTIDKSRLVGTSNTAGTSIGGIDPATPHPPDGSLKDSSTMDQKIYGINTGMLTDEMKPPPPPEPPPPTIFNIHQMLTMNCMLPKDPPIFNPEDLIGHPKENGETTNESLKIIAPDNQVTLEMDFGRHENNMLCIDKFIKNYEKFVSMIQTASVTSSLEKGDRPELDTSELCTQEHTMQYQSMIVALQWIVTIGWFDINTAILSMSGFRMASMEHLGTW
jgi:hypothetical protein